MRWSCQFRTYGGLTWHASAPETVDGPFPESAAYIHLHRAYIAASDKVRFNEPMHGRPRSRDDPPRFTRRVRFFNWAFILWWLISGRCCCEERGILLFFFFFLIWLVHFWAYEVMRSLTWAGRVVCDASDHVIEEYFVYFFIKVIINFSPKLKDNQSSYDLRFGCFVTKFIFIVFIIIVKVTWKQEKTLTIVT